MPIDRAAIKAKWERVIQLVQQVPEMLDQIERMRARLGLDG